MVNGVEPFEYGDEFEEISNRPILKRLRSFLTLAHKGATGHLRYQIELFFGVSSPFDSPHTLLS